ncbi:ATP-dependent DNA helicase MER3 [Amniculicola lignicola CBS 123094]|uniref:DNA 3'-5' helicase n=1 Tax=Amniculicola lignicola CBS 123094 TaxID=1392246 RepID=A0A6A5WNY8_9PLEO|nr:ATP-dependent DNA helicase MER3 [Amniculicola lignicola CBS 123094]
MAEDVFDILDELEHQGTARQYVVTQPQFKMAFTGTHQRGRYRASQLDNHALHDIVEDDGDDDGGDMRFGSFDAKLLHQSYDDRQTQAAHGRTRLSLAPKASSGFLGDVSQNQSQAQLSNQRQHTQSRQERVIQPAEGTGLARFAYNPAQLQDSSSDCLVGASSSPALMASKRRAEDINSSQLMRPLGARQNTRATERLPRETKVVRRTDSNQLDLPHAPPVVQGISLVPIAALPDRLRTIFPFPTFNAVQSKCFERVFKSDDNFVLASPTGSGKTVIMELAICRAMVTIATGQYKIVYQAPLKALCSERQRDWQKKFGPLGLNCVELTGDSDSMDLKNVQTANIIVTTPEKWDSITRKWRDHERLMRLVKLFLIDEVHILKEDRGASLEAVVSRMKNIGTDLRFIALSATLPNFEDVATWLGRNSIEPFEAANHEKFGEEFRPVRLRKHVCGYAHNGNDWQLEKFLDSKLPEVISKYSEGKPIMVFCCTRNSTISTAKLLAGWWASRHAMDRHWVSPSKPISFADRELREYAEFGVAFHHAGLDNADRLAVEKGFLNGDIGVICCTSTLAVGVNLPCHFVIIKNTVSFTNTGLQEYTDLEVLQMLGRAGRPQFDNSAVAVILTRQAKVRRYEMMVTGQDLVESRLHRNLIDHLNAEVVLGTVHDLTSAKKWLAGTFLCVRVKKNPSYYKLDGARSGQSLDELLDDICARDITLLQDTKLVNDAERFASTECGDAMARYYVQFETMQIFMNLQPKSQISEILSALVQAAELKDIRLRANEKTFYKNMNNLPGIRFPIPVTLNLPAHKISLMIQSILGSVDLVWEGEAQKNRQQFNMELSVVFKHVNRLIRCIIDCQLHSGDSVAIRHALLIQRSLAAKAWDDSPSQMKQLEGVGIVAVRKFVNAGIRSLEELEALEARRIEALMSRNPPFGLKLLDKLRSLPKLRVSVRITPNSARRTSEGVTVQVKAEIGIMNESAPSKFNGHPVYVCFLSETSTGRKVHFARISGFQLGKRKDLVFSALLSSADQCINCYVMCDSIAGTQREATVKPNVPSSMFTPTEPAMNPAMNLMPKTLEDARPRSNMSRRRRESVNTTRRPSGDEFGDDGLNDDDLVNASFGDLDFDHIENYANPTDTLTRKNTAKNIIKNNATKTKPRTQALGERDEEPKQLDNGRWACNHKCKDKNACKHFCCRDGLDKPPKKSARIVTSVNEDDIIRGETRKLPEKGTKTQSKLHLTASKRRASNMVEVLDMTRDEKKIKTDFGLNGPRDYRNLHQLHKTIQKKDPPASISSVMHKKPAYSYGAGGNHSLSFLESTEKMEQRPDSSDYGDIPLEEVPDHVGTQDNKLEKPASEKHGYEMQGVLDDNLCVPGMEHSDPFDDDDSMLGEAMVGLADSQDLQRVQGKQPGDEAADENYPYDDVEDAFDDMGVDGILGAERGHQRTPSPTYEDASSSSVKVPTLPPKKGQSLFLNDTSSPSLVSDGFRPAKTMLKDRELAEMRQTRTVTQETRLKKNENHEVSGLDENSPKIAESSQQDAEKPVPDAFKDLEPWLFAEFGDIVELINT